jgi:radical SAM protein with 4Fe4S-binding SPASM domain
MKEIQYKTFSLATHQKNYEIKRASVCQFELTFRCSLHCRHCYTDCYNKPAYLKKELNTQKVKVILDKIYQTGVIWLCFTGGDPLSRKDFLEVYSYAKTKGFIITVFTNGYLIDDKIIKCFKEKFPFVIEVTLNAATEKLYEKISQVKGSFSRVIKGIKLMVKEKLPLKIKTQVTKDNLEELPNIKRFLKRLGLEFCPSYILYPRLNGDKTPCNLRISPWEVLGLDGKTNLPEENCRLSLNKKASRKVNLQKTVAETKNNQPYLFPCAVGGGDGFYLDPYGNAFLCNLLREPKFNLLKVDVGYALNRLLPWARERKFLSNSKCKDCSLKRLCYWCPGRTYLEKKNMEAPIEYYCKLAKLTKNEI